MLENLENPLCRNYRHFDKHTNKMIYGMCLKEDKEGKKDAGINIVFKNNVRYIPMQCAGLLAKDGQPIYAGDIVECWSEGVKAMGVVTRRVDGLYIMWPAFQDGKEWKLCIDDQGRTGANILGNVYENPELLSQIGRMDNDVLPDYNL